MSQELKLEVDSALCFASGQCADIAPQVFGHREDDGTVALLSSTPAPEFHDEVREAAMQCPANAILLSPAAGES